MQVRPELQIQTIIKAMVDDVLPALDQNNQLAMQSAQLTIGTLTMIAQHLPLEYRFDCDELAGLLNMANSLHDQVSGTGKDSTALAALAGASTVGKDVLDRARAEPSEIVKAIRQLRATTSELVRLSYQEGDEQLISDVEKTVLAASKQQLLRDRSWLLMQGWEPDPEKIPAIDSLLAPIAALKERD